MNEHYQIAKEELKNIIASVVSEIMDEKKAKPDFLDLDKDGDKEEPMKKAAKDKKEKVEEKYATSQDDEHADAQELGAKLAKKKKVDEMDLEKEKEDAEVMDDAPALQESKQVVTETPQQPKEVKETDKTWYNTSLYSKLVSRWTKKGDK